eukprot:TRINITY_DN781963_c0_g1_i1.p1 TRINITY_DN781963_c0_g1~~TRINITY_DN781963_c0_g1_i1.p1  ORF type:complete len:286 (-),score=51.47 TRINITY_DN781963_c0_g1_i1:181-1038(-)
MRFVGRINNTSLPQFIEILGALSKVSKTLFITFIEEELKITVKGARDDHVDAYANLPLGGFFENVIIKSKRENNAITLQLEAKPLIDALKSATEAQTIATKLSQVDGRPCMRLHWQSGGITITQNIPCQLVSGPQAKELEEPKISRPDCQVALPDRTALRTMIDRLRTMSKDLLIYFSMFEGMMMLNVDSDIVHVETTYRDLKGHAENCSEGTTGRAKVRINGANFKLALPPLTFRTQQTVASVITNEMMFIHTSLGIQSGSILHFIPILSSEYDDDGDEEEEMM